MRKLMIIIISAILSLTKCLHLKGHYQSTNSISQLNGIEETIMKSVNQISENIQKNNKNLTQAQTTDQKIGILEAYLLQQRKELLNTVKASLLDLNSTSYSCPSLNQTDKATLSTLNQQVNNLFIGLSKSSSKIQNINTNEIIDIIPAISSNNLPIYSKNGQIDAESGRIENSFNINNGYYVLGNATIQSLTQPSQQIGKYNEICSYDLPFINSLGQCTACPHQKSYYLVDNSSCIECQTYNETTRKCSALIVVSYFTNYDAGNDQLLLSDSENIDDYKLNKQNLPVCPAETPFFNGNSCISCSNKLYFSLKDKNCQTCPAGQFYNIYNKKCQIQFYFSNLNNLQWETNSKQVDDILESITIKRSNESYTACPLDSPFSINQKCIKCQNGSHFSYDILSCANCSNDTKLDLNMHKCLKPGNLNFQTNPLNTTNLIFNGRSKNEWMNIYYQNLQKYSGIVDCPLDQPNFDGLACISCPHSHPYFNLELMICQTCEGTTLYDQSQHQCISGSDNRPIQTPSWQKMAAVVFTK